MCVKCHLFQAFLFSRINFEYLTTNSNQMIDTNLSRVYFIAIKRLNIRPWCLFLLLCNLNFLIYVCYLNVYVDENPVYFGIQIKWRLRRWKPNEMRNSITMKQRKWGDIFFVTERNIEAYIMLPHTTQFLLWTWIKFIWLNFSFQEHLSKLLDYMT